VRPEVEAILETSGDEFRDLVLANARALSHEVKDVPEEARLRLIEVVQAAWPKDGVAANVERAEHEVRFRGWGAHAWLTLGPAFDITPTAEQWADVACSGVLLSDTSDWLSRHYTEEAALFAARSCKSGGVRPWSQLVSSIPTDARTPDELVDAIVAHMSEPTVPEPDYELWSIGERFVREDRLDALQALSAKSEELERRLRPWRARLGNSGAAETLLVEMTAALAAGRRFDRDEETWLEGVSEPKLLALLFEALGAALSTEGDSPFGVSSALGRAIYRIGGDDAVLGYDELIASSDDSRFKFLRLQRDEIVQAELRVAGQRRSAEVAGAIGAPVLAAAAED
jgi:hypothetical protein